ncbi:MAG TPA: methyltransferase domain-containing protein [Pirellulales bacterium]|jgi:S-adenosylmethionine-dependent methyltransferase|nr:methyltransferase domain-containing protein [Pirellulales bacterium]
MPAHLQSRFRSIDGETQEKLRTRLHDFRRTATGRPSDDDDDLQNHLHRRLDDNRRQVVPWLDAARPLADASVLEIGCGTGSATVALAEQGARVTAIDIDPRAIAVAEERCRMYGVEARFLPSNAAELDESLTGQRFDFILFFASLEHMTHEERLAAMARTWHLLPSGGLWGIVETPNRLWYYDHHTAHLNFFMWLSDELAADYVRFSPRDDVRGQIAQAEDPKLALRRAGRGASFHEFDLTLGDSRCLDVVSSMPLFFRDRDPALRLQWRLSREREFERFLARLCPDLHLGFLQPTLYLLIRKP